MLSLSLPPVEPLPVLSCWGIAGVPGGLAEDCFPAVSWSCVWLCGKCREVKTGAASISFLETFRERERERGGERERGEEV